MSEFRAQGRRELLSDGTISKWWISIQSGAVLGKSIRPEYPPKYLILIRSIRPI